MIILSTPSYEILLAKFEDSNDLRYIVMEIEDGVRQIVDIAESDNIRLLASMIHYKLGTEEYTIHGEWNFGRATTPVTRIQKILEQYMKMETIDG
ncbi:hypothetical protein EVB55_119 [Rhizobium phage RHph_Y68]|uniref:Uncharacterized protein n=1 Tax=Rhizobium phage RHph_Y68 TaxID=2509787 RepID=A0A7S5R9L5_9CAUD|nr:hypothetical protein PP934_gp119 [Rhizobium phage RHph_Y68]QIG68054.1 hypothetical protein EVB55_119 [Rhizobium phage RHph_Y68]